MMGSRLEFKPGNHTYWLDGLHVPGVTTTINRAHEKPGLVYAAAREAGRWAVANLATLDESRPDPWIKKAANAHRELWDAKAERGTFLHDAARQLVRGDPLTPETDGEPWPEDVVASAQQIARFMDEWDVEPEWTECAVFHETHIWAGTVDLIARVRDGRRLLLDYKTGETGVYPKDALQLATYRHATHIQVSVSTDGGEPELTDYPMPEVDGAACVWIRPDFYEIRPVLTDYPSYDVFLHMLPVARWTGWKARETVFDPLPIPEAV